MNSIQKLLLHGSVITKAPSRKKQSTAEETLQKAFHKSKRILLFVFLYFSPVQLYRLARTCRFWYSWVHSKKFRGIYGKIFMETLHKKCGLNLSFIPQGRYTVGIDCTIDLRTPFYISTEPLRLNQWRCITQKLGIETIPKPLETEKESHKVVLLSASQCIMLAKSLFAVVPDWKQWEIASRGPMSDPYPWGSSVDEMRLKLKTVMHTQSHEQLSASSNAQLNNTTYLDGYGEYENVASHFGLKLLGSHGWGELNTDVHGEVSSISSEDPKTCTYAISRTLLFVRQLNGKNGMSKLYRHNRDLRSFSNTSSTGTYSFRLLFAADSEATHERKLKSKNNKSRSPAKGSPTKGPRLAERLRSSSNPIPLSLPQHMSPQKNRSSTPSTHSSPPSSTSTILHPIHGKNLSPLASIIHNQYAGSSPTKFGGIRSLFANDSPIRQSTPSPSAMRQSHNSPSKTVKLPPILPHQR